MESCNMWPYVLLFLIEVRSNFGQSYWTQIQPESPQQIDLWTVSSTGCACPFNKTLGTRCACCAKKGACHCGNSHPQRCSQCGLQSYCDNMCNMTISADLLKKHSGKLYGQLRSPNDMRGPLYCSYTFLGGDQFRIELQIYRLIRVGQYLNHSCVRGYLKFYEEIKNENPHFICGDNESFTPPVVLFKDALQATLEYRVEEETVRSRFQAFFSFTKRSEEYTGFQHRGAVPIKGKQCDWIVKQSSCEKTRTCKVTSPSYPGLFPPHSQCFFFISANDSNHTITVSFKRFMLPNNSCNRTFVKFYGGRDPLAPLIDTLCGTQKKKIQFAGQHLLMEFKSGYVNQPYDYNGFLATIEFRPKVLLKQSIPQKKNHGDVVFLVRTTPIENKSTHWTEPTPTATNLCDEQYSSQNEKSGVVSYNNSNSSSNGTCYYRFRTKENETIRITFLSIVMRDEHCSSFITALEGQFLETVSYKDYLKHKPVFEICSPYSEKHISATNNRSYISTSNWFIILSKQSSEEDARANNWSIFYEFIIPDYTIKFETNDACNYTYEGKSPFTYGELTFSNWSLSGLQLDCKYHFMPMKNQSIRVEMASIPIFVSNPICRSICDDITCRCITNSSSPVDTLQFSVKSFTGHEIFCVCDNISITLPVVIRSTQLLTISFTLPNETETDSGLFTGSYIFENISLCPGGDLTGLAGMLDYNFIISNAISVGRQIHYAECKWILEVPPSNTATLTMDGPHNGQCSKLNITISAVPRLQSDPPKPHTYCGNPRPVQVIVLPHYKFAHIRVFYLDNQTPKYSVSWKLTKATSNHNSPVIHFLLIVPTVLLLVLN